jgi:hypothetical protein
MAFKESEIQKMMKSLDLTREEAIQLLQDDEDDVTAELSPEQEKVAKSMSQADRKVETKKRGRPYVPNEDKRHLMALLEIAVGHNPDVTDWNVTNVEREATFRYKGELYRLTLAKPRVKKD